MAIFKSKLICPVCGARRGMDRTMRDFCSTKCKRIYNNTPIVNTRSFIKCANCDIEFQPKTDKNIYCSKMCSSIYIKNSVKVYTSDFSIFERDSFRCVYCGKSSIEHGIELHVDHIDPLSINGIACTDNLITACKNCNSGKNARLLSDEVRLRLFNLVLLRNKNISIQQFALIEKEVELIRIRDRARLKKMA